MTNTPTWLAVGALIGLAGCADARNYPDPSGPRYAGGVATPSPDPIVKVVSFNIRYARRIDLALEVFQKDGLQGRRPRGPPGDGRSGRRGDGPRPRLPIRLLPGSAFHPGGGKDFGNAVLSRWPIVGDHKILAAPRKPVPRAPAGGGGGDR